MFPPHTLPITLWGWRGGWRENIRHRGRGDGRYCWFNHGQSSWRIINQEGRNPPAIGQDQPGAIPILPNHIERAAGFRTAHNGILCARASAQVGNRVGGWRVGWGHAHRACACGRARCGEDGGGCGDPCARGRDGFCDGRNFIGGLGQRNGERADRGFDRADGHREEAMAENGG